jgi:hypothetical protein
VFDDKVVLRGISIRLGNTQSMRGSSRHETHLRPLAPLLGVLDIASSVCHENAFLGNAGLGLETGNKKARPGGPRFS